MLRFFKMNGIGNSFIFFDENIQDYSCIRKPERIRAICDPGTGIGADGVVFVMPPGDIDKNNCKMEIYNSDGSRAEMCGNALRCVAHLYLSQRGDLEKVSIETDCGDKTVTLAEKTDAVVLYKAQIGKASFDLVSKGELIPDFSGNFAFDGKDYAVEYVNVGNPHAVMFLKKMPCEQKIKKIGKAIENHNNHPKKINVEFVEITSRNSCSAQIWERGCGITKACGTGACAIVAAGIKNGLFDNKVKVSMPGGSLTIEQDKGKNLYMTGPVQEVVYGHLSGVFVSALRKI